jgi:heterotetrameric sarcosine oxidase gamma subunit
MAQSNPADMPTPLQQAGVEPQSLARPTLTLSELRACTILRLHSLESPAALASKAREAGLALPLEINQVSGTDPVALCLRPAEWVLFSENSAADSLSSRLRTILDPALTALLDVSDAVGVFRLSGAAAPWLLSKLSSLDFLSGVSAGPHAASTRMGDIAVAVHFQPAADGTPSFDLIFDRSVAPYLWRLLTDGAPHAEELHTRHGEAA